MPNKWRRSNANNAFEGGCKTEIEDCLSSVLKPSSNALFTLLHLRNHVTIRYPRFRSLEKRKKCRISSLLKPITNNLQLPNQNFWRRMKDKNVRSGAPCIPQSRSALLRYRRKKSFRALQLMLLFEALRRGARKSVLRLQKPKDPAQL